ncbi:TPT-domain-containing protein [Polychaeton citri CBS 116435]|uniref:TPT-domain-containing protein n=1 Tax=Polychaeton citri CBS 116435 TaxID=1314669 RepID=A0A9P4QEB5_9PEZI|nr:TPT-domain-containing protein [Polychaeton citri CBS 116435]
MEDELPTLTTRRRSSSVVQFTTGSGQNSNCSGSTATASCSSSAHTKAKRISEEFGPGSDLEMGEIRAQDHLDDHEEFETDEERLTDDEETGLTQKDRENRQRKRRRNTQLDERVAGDGSGASRSVRNGQSDAALEKQLVNATLLRYYLINALLIGLWYTFSISISVYNKWMFSKKNLDFHFPLFTTSFHMLVQFTLAALVLFFMPQFRPSNGSAIDPHHGGSSGGGNYQRVANEDSAGTSAEPPSDDVAGKKSQPLMTKWFYFTRISPCGTATALDIGLGNFSLRYISLTFYTMCKSSVLGFVLLFAFLFGLETVSWKLLGIIAIMIVGVIMMVAGETAFEIGGFLLVMSASFCSGFRWSLSQILLLRNAATSNPFSSIFFLTPIMFLALIILALPIEKPSNLVEGIRILTETKGSVVGFLLLLFPGTLAFLMVAAEFALLKRTSVVTLSVCGIFKEVLTILAAGIIFGDELSPINVSGLIVTIGSIAAYNWFKYARMKSDAEKSVARHIAADGTGSADDDNDDTDSDDGHYGLGDTLKQGRDGLMRNSLPVDTQGLNEPAVIYGVANVAGQSPDKRPQDFE